MLFLGRALFPLHRSTSLQSLSEFCQATALVQLGSARKAGADKLWKIPLLHGRAAVPQRVFVLPMLGSGEAGSSYRSFCT